MKFRTLLEQPVENKAEVGDRIYAKSLQVLEESLMSTGGTTASMKGSRYYGHTYPRDHAYAIRAFSSAGKFAEAKKALVYILSVELSPDGVMFQRYGEDQKTSSNKPPQIDGNAQTLIALADYVEKSQDRELFERYIDQVRMLISGLKANTQSFPQGELVFSINGIIEFAPFEEGFDLYTNACVYKALKETAVLFSEFAQDSDTATELEKRAERVQQGIANYLYIPEYGGFVSCVRKEPNPSVVVTANLKSFLTLADFDVFEVADERMLSSLEFHLEGTKNEEIGGYNRYAAAMGRHNFGNGPWPMVMLRLSQLYFKLDKKSEVEKTLNWVMNVALLNKEVELGLPEHVVTKVELLKEFHGFMRTFDINPREERKKEYEKNEQSIMMKEYDVAYPINPLVWSHSQFVIVWDSMRGEMMAK